MKSSLAPRHGRLYRRMAADAAALRPPPGPASAAPVTEDDLAGLPAAAQRYLRFMEVPGRPPGEIRYNVTPADLRPGEHGHQLPGDDLIPDLAAASGSRP